MLIILTLKTNLKKSIKNILFAKNSVFVTCDMFAKGTAIPVQTLRVPGG